MDVVAAEVLQEGEPERGLVLCLALRAIEVQVSRFLLPCRKVRFFGARTLIDLGFNGAAARMPRKGPGVVGPWRQTHRLQWGRGGVAAESSHDPGATSAPAGFNSPTFGLLWTPTEYVFYVDGKETWRTAAGGVCQVPLYIELSDEIGTWAGDIKKVLLPDEFLVDYIRGYDVVTKPDEGCEPG
jgi:hypothetical protein